MKNIKGQFEIKAMPLDADPATQRIGAMRTQFEKQFLRDLSAQSVVAMMGLMNRDLGSGGYVALERVDGVLDGRRGTFCLQHSSMMTRGQPQQSITVVPDSGTGDLAGIKGHMTIDIVKGVHHYSFDYEF